MLVWLNMQTSTTLQDKVKAGEPIADPVLLLHVHKGQRLYPCDVANASRTPEWAKPALEVAFALDQG